MTQSEARRDGERKLFNILFCAVSSVLILAVCSMNSPLYPFNGHVDVNIFVTVARGIQRGLMPYRDLIDQKGPLLFCLHALFLPLAPGYFNGIFLWECISFTVILYFFHRIARNAIKQKCTPSRLILIIATQPANAPCRRNSRYFRRLSPRSSRSAA